MKILNFSKIFAKNLKFSTFLALFECVEENQYEQLKALLEQKQLNINALNNDGFSVLDLAVLLNSRSITKLLLQHGAQTGNFPNENIESHLNTLLSDSEKKLSQINSSSTSSSGQISVGLESEKISVERRIKLIRKMINGWQRLRAPDPPFSFTIGKCRNCYYNTNANFFLERTIVGGVRELRLKRKYF